jgi:hypothetical protein
MLYAAYRFAEHLGVRFYLHGDVVPDELIPLALPMLDERAKPLFALRGIQPFHDFPEGPDWWNLDDYQAYLSQLPKLRMNFFGLHTYPEDRPNAEPTVWIGLPDDFTEDRQVKFSYPSSYQNTLRGNWGYQSKKTSDFAFGAAALFEHDAFGPEVMLEACPQPQTPEACNAVFNRTGAMLREAFRHARALGIKTCVGTETPLTIPKAVQERLRQQGKNPKDPAVVQSLYEGIFQRIKRTYPLDYYWFWTPEGWTWSGAKDEHVSATTNDLFLAINAAKNVQAQFRLATCGWVLGPQQDRALFDKVLPKDMPVSCINREVGKAPVEPGFAQVKDRSKWAIPWLEDDPALTSPQLWVGRMRQDAVDALQYGCDGLMGINWRTRVLGPNVSALAQAAWTQSPWRKAHTPQSSAVGGQTAAFPNNPIEGTEDDPLYQTVRYGLSAYRLAAPIGAYRVTLKFCEPHYSEAGKRVFAVKIQDTKVLDQLDIFAKTGKNRALDYSYDNIKVADGWLNIEFIPQVEFPSIAAIAVEGTGFAQKINCGGPTYQDYAADLAPPSRFQPVLDFYQDWAWHQFGPQIAAGAAAVFAEIDGTLPRPSDWVDGPGGTRPDARPWDQVRREYAFVDEFAALRSQVKGAGNLERFDYWLNTFQYMRAMGQLNCVWAEFNQALEKVKAEKDTAVKKKLASETALALRKQLVQRLGEVYQHLLATVTSPGELGTVANWEQHIQPGLITKPGKELEQALGEPLPPEAQLPNAYAGTMRVIVPTVQTSLAPGNPLKLKVLILAAETPQEAALYWRTMGKGDYAKTPLVHVARGVYRVETLMSPTNATAFEYYLKIVPAKESPVYFPATAPDLNQTIVMQP